MNNSRENDDIDFLIVTADNRLWITRLVATILLELFCTRRRPGDKIFTNKICLNMFLDEKNLRLPGEERNLFTAHEVCQLKLIWERKNIYAKFIRVNKWTSQYLANWKN